MGLGETLYRLTAELDSSLRELSHFGDDMRAGLDKVTEPVQEMVNKLASFKRGKKTFPSRSKETQIELKLTESQFDLLEKTVIHRAESLDKHGAKLRNMAFMYLSALLDAFQTDVFTETLRARPQMLKSKKQLTYESILNLGSPEEITRHMALKELNEVAYKSISDQWLYFSDRFGIDPEKRGIKLEDLVEMNLQRNLLAHNRGIANEIYYSASTKKLMNIGDSVEISEDDLKKYIDFSRNVAFQIAASLMLKFDPSYLDHLQAKERSKASRTNPISELQEVLRKASDKNPKRSRIPKRVSKTM